MNAVAVAVIDKPVYSAFAGHLSHGELMRRHIDTLMMLGLALVVYLPGLLVIGDPKRHPYAKLARWHGGIGERYQLARGREGRDRAILSQRDFIYGQVGEGNGLERAECGAQIHQREPHRRENLAP